MLINPKYSPITLPDNYICSKCNNCRIRQMYTKNVFNNQELHKCRLDNETTLVLCETYQHSGILDILFYIKNCNDFSQIFTSQ